MTSGFPDRLTQLRGRWQSDPSSRVFLQLAEEYRHLGRVKEALEVLEAGLREHPGYLSALVAQGRCLLELGDPARARAVLERVVQQDATQMVANKLLVRACLETGEPERARQRLDLYTLLNDRDPEIDELDRRVTAMSRPPLASDGPRPEEPAERPRMDSPLPPKEGLHPATPPSPSRAAAPALDDIFDLGAPPRHPVATQAPPDRASEAIFDLPLAPQASAAPPETSQATPATPATIATPAKDPFPELHAPERMTRYLRALEAEGIFSLGFRGEPAPAVATPPEPAAAVTTQPEPAPAAAEPESVPAAAPLEAAEQPATGATATLGFLYLRQGHLAEAERIFREVVSREPDNGAAGQALAGLERRRRPLEAAHLLEGFEGGEQASSRARKTYLLHSYLRLLKAGPGHVS